MEDKQYFEQHKNSILRFLKIYFPHSVAVIVSGSIVSGYFDKTSDVYIVILSNINGEVFIESYNFEGIKMQAIILPLFGLNEIFQKEINAGEGIFLNMIATGYILIDRTSICKTVQEKAQYLWNKGPKKPTDYGINQMRSALTSRLEDLSGDKTFEENLFIAIDVYNRLLSLYTAYRGEWKSVGKYAARYLAKNDPIFRQEYISSFERFIQNHNEKHLIVFVENFLETVGGALHFLSSRKQYELPVDNKLVIYIQTPVYKTGLEPSSAIQLLYDFKVFLNHHLSNVPCSFLQNFDDTVLPQGLYAVFHWNNNKIIEHLLPLVQSYHFNLEQSLQIWRNNWVYPSSYDPIEVYGNKDVQNIILDILSYVNMRFFGKLSKEFPVQRTSFETSFFVIKHFENFNFFKSGSIKNIFWEDTMQYFLNSNRTGIQASTAKLNDFYNKQDIDNYKNNYVKNFRKIKILYNTEADKELKDKLLKLEILFHENSDIFCDRYDFSHWKLKNVGDKDTKFASILFSLITKIQQACFLEKERSYNIFCLKEYFQQ